MNIAFSIFIGREIIFVSPCDVPDRFLAVYGQVPKRVEFALASDPARGRLRRRARAEMRWSQIANTVSPSNTVVTTRVSAIASCAIS